MQLVRTAQPKHKINLLSLSTEAGGPDVGHLVCSINSMQFVRTAQFKHKHLLALYSHSPRRTGGPQAPASGALVYIIINLFMYYNTMVLFCFVWCLCMAINVSGVQHNGGFLPGIILLTQCYYHRGSRLSIVLLTQCHYHRGTRLDAMKRFCICSP